MSAIALRMGTCCLAGRVLGQRYALPVVVQDVFDFNRCRSDVHDLVAAIDDVAFHRDENILSLGEEDFLGFTGLVREAKELEINRRWRLRWWRRRWSHRGGFVGGDFCDGSGYVDLRHENISAAAR